MNNWLHDGEREAQARFGMEGFDWNARTLDVMFSRTILPKHASVIESVPFFFLATASAGGECDCSFRSREVDASGRPEPLVLLLDDTTLVFPDYPGNKVYNSLGNILVNPRIGMLFIDFEARTRVRLNGRAEIVEDPVTHAQLWPSAARHVRVTAEQVFGNCRRRIPRMRPVPDAT